MLREGVFCCCFIENSQLEIVTNSLTADMSQCAKFLEKKLLVGGACNIYGNNASQVDLMCKICWP